MREDRRGEERVTHTHTHRERLFNDGKIGEEMREDRRGEERVTHTHRERLFNDGKIGEEMREDRRGGGESHTHTNTQRKIME